jgi:ATP-dependent RNA helicase RhlE
VVRFARTLLKNPVSISIAVSKPAENITQHVYMVPDQHKNALMTSLLKDKVGQRIIVFGSTRQSVTALYQRLKARNMSVGQISSDVEQDMREQIMLDFRNRKIDVLIATDVLSRGIDVDGIDVVVNFDVPRDPEDYVHRIGRTARAARSGLAITLVNSTDLPKFARIERFLDKKIEKLPLPEQFEGAMSLPPRKDSGERSSRPGNNNNKRPSRPPGNQPRKPQQAASTSPKPPAEIHPDADPVKDKKPRRRKRGNRKKEGDVAKVSNGE